MSNESENKSDKIIDNDTIKKVIEAYWKVQGDIYANEMDLSDFSSEDIVDMILEELEGKNEQE